MKAKQPTVAVMPHNREGFCAQGNRPRARLKICLFAVSAYCLIIALMLAACGGTSDIPLLPGLPEAIAFWQKQAPDDALVLSISGDINGDRRPDTLIIYRTPSGECLFIGILDTIDGYQLTDTIMAPLENQAMFIRNIGGNQSVAVFVSGQNGDKVGLGCFQLIGAEWINPFGGGIFDGDYAACCGL